MEFTRGPKAMTSKRQNRSDSRRPTPELPADYSVLLVDFKNRIRAAQIRASLSVNRELIQLYWESRCDKFLSQLVREIYGEHLPRVAAEIP
jgi:hypothetical protein